MLPWRRATHSADYPDDDDWHDAQNEWLSKWSVRVLLDGPLRRWQWDDRVQEHKRLMAAAAKGGAEPPTPKRKYARKPAVPIAHEPVLAGPPRRKRPLPLSKPAYELAMGKYGIARDNRRKLPRRSKTEDADRKRDARELTAQPGSRTCRAWKPGQTASPCVRYACVRASLSPMRNLDPPEGCDPEGW